MSEEDVELIRRSYHAWNEHGVDGIAEFFAEDVEWVPPPELPDYATYRGREATVEFLRSWRIGGGAVNLDFELEEVREVGDRYLAISRAWGKGDSSATPVPEHHWYHLLEVRDGKLTKARLFLDEAQALEAAGLSE